MKHLHTLTILILVIAIASCARIGSPSGGLKDSIPPVMAIAKPMNMTTSFKEKKITIYFDEYIKFKNLNSQLIVSPPMEKKPMIKPEIGVSKKISIQFLDSLTPNTTYTINFGNSIVDNNEGNELGKFSYVFSTGDFVDSLKIAGNITDPFENKAVEKISILAYKNANDTLVGNYTPNYLTNTLESNFFSLENLSEASYQLIALEDKNNNYKYDKGYEKIGFLDKSINLKAALDSINFILFKESKQSKIFNPTQARGNQIILGYQGDHKAKIEIKGLDKNHFMVSQLKDKDSLFLWLKKTPQDSLHIHMTLDTLNRTFIIKPRELDKDTLLIQNLTQNILHPHDSVKISSNIPIIQINKDSIQLLESDSIPIPYKVINSLKNHFLTFNFKRKRETNYSLVIKKTAFKDYLNNYNDEINIRFNTLNMEEYGEIVLKIKNPKNHNLIFDLINTATKKTLTRISNISKTISFKDIEPSEYDLRITKDLNNNNKFDTGNFEQKVQPEEIINYKQKIILRANSEIIENILVD